MKVLGCRLKQSPPLSAPSSLGSAFARRPHPAPLAPLTRLAPASDFWVPGSRFRAQLGSGSPDDRLGPISDRALDFYRVPLLGRGCGWDPGRLEGVSEGLKLPLLGPQRVPGPWSAARPLFSA